MKGKRVATDHLWFEVFPLPKGGGPIEGFTRPQPFKGIWKFPLPKGGGPIEGIAFSVWADLVDMFPLPKGGGPIEGREAVWLQN